MQPEEGNATREFSLAVVIASTGNFPQGNPLYTPTVVTLKVYLCEESMIKNNAVSCQFALPFLFNIMKKLRYEGTLSDHLQILWLAKYLIHGGFLYQV